MSTTKKTIKQTALDGWANILTGLGIKNRDKALASKPVQCRPMTHDALEAIYTGDGFGRRIIDLIADEMTREWFKVQGDTENDIGGALDDLNAKKRIRSASKWARLYGGAIVVMGIKDGGDLEDPVNEKKIDEIEFLHVFDMTEAQYTTTDLYSDPNNPKFGEPEFYTVNAARSSTQFRVHESRVLRFDGAEVPNRLIDYNQGWGWPELQHVYEHLRRLGISYGLAENIMDDFVQAVLTVKNLQDMIVAGQDDLIKKRLDILDMSRNIINTMILDEGETYEKKTSTITGLPDLLDRFAQALSAVTGIPVTLLMGQAPAGLQATGASDIRNFYDMIASRQEDDLQPQLERLVRLLMLSRNGPTKGKELDNWKIEFTPLWQMTDKEVAEIRKTHAETDTAYVNAGVLDPAEVAISRFGGDQYGTEITIDVEAREAMKKAGEEEPDPPPPDPAEQEPEQDDPPPPATETE